jgi:subfamily B ATP-binding cassette protein MsbA
VLHPTKKKSHGIGELFADYKVILAKRPRLLAAAIILSLAAAVAEGVGLSILYPILDSVVSSQQDQGRLWQALRALAAAISGSSVVEGLLLLAVGIFFLKALLLISSNALTNIWINRLQEDWCLLALGHYLYGPYSAIISMRRGQMLQNALNEPFIAAKGVETLLNLLTKSILAAALVVTLLVLNWRMTLGLIVFVTLIGLLVRPYLFRPMEKLGRKRLAAKQTIQAVAAEPLFAAGSIKLLGAEATILERLRPPLRKFTRANVLTSVFSKAPADVIEFIVVAVVAGTFIGLAHGFGVPFQEAAPLIGSFAVVSWRLLGTLSALLGKRLNIASVAASLLLVQRLVRQDSTHEHVDAGAELEAVETDIAFQDVGFSYTPGISVFSGLSLAFPKGRVTGLIGTTGVGKSTIGHLLVRLYDADSGSILINHRDIKEFSLRSVRRRFAYIEQNPVVFNGTIEENIRLGAPDASREEVVSAALAAGLGTFIDTLPNGYETHVSDQGATLSGGEKQRIAIARAIIRKPDVFIFDEGTSALDRKTELVIQQSIQRLAGKATLILIAHRITTLKDADLIYEILPSGEAVVRSFEELAA